MASVVDIWNMALGHVGSPANISSTAETGAAAQHCARLYPIARDSLLEMHDWHFATRRDALAVLVEEPAFGWTYAYAWPDSALAVFAVLPYGATDDYTTPLTSLNTPDQVPLSTIGVVQPQPFAVEINESETRVILTNVEGANARFTVRITDPSVFSPTFTNCLSFLLASYLAGPIIKGTEGMKIAEGMRNTAASMLVAATRSDTRQQKSELRDAPMWMANR